MHKFFVLIISFLFLGLTACSKKEEPKNSPTGKTAMVPSTQTANGDIAVKKEMQKEKLEDSASQAADQKVNFSTISGRKLGGLYADMLGVSGTIPTSATVNFAENLADMWARKINRKKISDASVDNAHTPLSVFLENPKKINLKKFVSEADAEITLVNKNIRWSSMCKSYKLAEVECKMLKTIVLDIRGVDLIAYGMTELMPSAEGDLNVKILNILLQNAGSNYIMAVPAMYDQMLSFGLYQFTSYALRDDGKKLEGASRVNKHLQKSAQIPGSVIKLRNGENHRAAYLFAIHNFALLCKQTNAKEFAVLRLATKRKPGDLVTFMATAHHAPGLAIKSARVWLQKGAKEDLNPYLIGRLKPYGKKTDANLAALERVIK